MYGTYTRKKMRRLKEGSISGKEEGKCGEINE